MISLSIMKGYQLRSVDMRKMELIL
ncbi:hypothetical protein [Priestia aryabhattai]